MADMLRGGPGTGKAILGAHFLTAGDPDESPLYINVEEPTDRIVSNAASVGVLRKRASDFDRSIRSFDITAAGLGVGAPVTGMSGVLTGTPESTGDE